MSFCGFFCCVDFDLFDLILSLPTYEPNKHDNIDTTCDKKRSKLSSLQSDLVYFKENVHFICVIRNLHLTLPYMPARSEDVFVYMAPAVLLLHLYPALKCLFGVLLVRLSSGFDGAVGTWSFNSQLWVQCSACYSISTSGNMCILSVRSEAGLPWQNITKESSCKCKTT